jgi:hypothetical protein
MMRAMLKATLMLCALSALAAAAAQAPVDPRGAHGVEVLGFEWKYEGYAPFEVVRSERSGDSLKTARGAEYVFKYVARLTVKNSGAKAIRSVKWNHLFVEPDGGKELKRYRLQSKQEVAPGETQTLSKAVFIKPGESMRHFTTGKQTIQITRVEFADGTFWRPDDADDAPSRKP